MWRCCGWLRSLKWVVIEAYCSAIVLRSGRKGSVMGFATVSSSNLALFVQRSGRGGAVMGFAPKGVPGAQTFWGPWNAVYIQHIVYQCFAIYVSSKGLALG